MSALIGRWDNLEYGFSADRYNGDGRVLRAWCPALVHRGDGAYLLPARGKPSVVLTAVHGSNHRRDRVIKWADRGTGSLALLLAEVTGCAALVAPDAPGDANHDLNHPVKDALQMLHAVDVETVIDVHGSAHLPDSPDIDLGTSAGYVPARFVRALTEQTRLRVTVNAARSASSSRRVTSFAQAYGMTAVQLEIDALLRPPVGFIDRRERLVVAMAEAICAQAPMGQQCSIDSAPGARRLGSGW